MAHRAGRKGPARDDAIAAVAALELADDLSSAPVAGVGLLAAVPCFGEIDSGVGHR
jgi:hypothetical protein